MRIRVKICGVTDDDAIRAAVAVGADAVGFVFAESPRRVALQRACELAAMLPPLMSSVAVFRHPSPDDVMRVVEILNPHVVQTEVSDALVAALDRRVPLLPVLHDHESLLEDELPSLPSAGASRMVLLEAAGRGGRGVKPDWSRAERLARRCRLVLAGGLSPDNVGEAIRTVGPWGVDVSSGVEREPGIKDPERIIRFVAGVRAEERSGGHPVEAEPCE